MIVDIITVECSSMSLYIYEYWMGFRYCIHLLIYSKAHTLCRKTDAIEKFHVNIY